MKFRSLLLVPLVGIFIYSCSSNPSTSTPKPFEFKEKLSEYGFFEGRLADLSPAPSVHLYTLNTPLFTDYAYKARFIQLPEGKKMKYVSGDLPEFPIGTVLIKNFFYYQEESKPSLGRRIIETRLLVKDIESWEVATYIWNEAQTDASYELLGGKTDVEWRDKAGKLRKVTYVIPDNNDCKSCHKRGGEVSPIGPKIRNLNVDFEQAATNQLAVFALNGMIEDLPNEVEQLPVWDDTRFELAQRARAYLDVNCAHCHSAQGPANNTALNLNFEEQDPHKLGICKGPVSAAQGSGDLRFDIVPGDAEASIIHFRMKDPETGIAMPEIGKSLVHTEGVALIKQWIDQMEGGNCN